jgi:hypothetical protein
LIKTSNSSRLDSVVRIILVFLLIATSKDTTKLKPAYAAVRCRISISTF